jgi:hypothetical protein
MAPVSRIKNNKEKEKMMLEARPVVKNKFWIVEQAGQQVATIQAAPDGVVLVKGQKREKFVSFKLLKDKYNIHVGRATKLPTKDITTNEIYNYPTDCRPYNELYDVRRRLPFYTKSAKSKSVYCAGYYAIQLNGEWARHFCPKSITVNRYPFHGPYATPAEADRKLDQLKTS